MQTLYRLVKAVHQETAFSGRGALLSDGRWHRQGARIVYAADAPSSTLLEVLVHTKAPGVLETPYVLFEITFDPERHRVVLPDEALPEHWKAVPWPRATQDLGMLWYTRQHAVLLEVPSAVVSQQRNYLINLNHPHFGELIIEGPEAFEVDARLVR